VVICLDRVADLHMAQLMPLSLTVCCFSKIQIGFTFLVPAYPNSPGQRAVKWVCVCQVKNSVTHVLITSQVFFSVCVFNFKLDSGTGKPAYEDSSILHLQQLVDLLI